ncbi:hypothetical protein Mal33_24040 [Rosistilla oblonga]|uniref:SMEK domain-containing protein n=2 Tax=Rosistilla oblonga TaxID=2527990 RepID=A0A518ITK0_9BACT|nr:hypothetical protein Mal33_24040 [Rosistilla oblonga]
MNRQKLIDEISEQLAILTHKIKLQNGLNLTDLNIHAENFFRDFLNLLHGFSLCNCNADNQNAATIDLRDDENRIAIQVTSNSQRAEGDTHNTSRRTFKAWLSPNAPPGGDLAVINFGA